MNFEIRMAPNHHFMLNSIPLEPVSRTYQYRKIMKPMLERKRRARINKCLDELKDLMMGTLQADGENISKLEKADILELTVRHLHRLREHNALFVHGSETLNVEKFWAGFQHCAAEVSQFLSKYDRNIGGDLIKYMANYIPNVAAAAAAAAATTTTTIARASAPSTPTPTASTPALQAAAAAATTANYQRFCTAVNHHFNQQPPPPPPPPSPTPKPTRTPSVSMAAKILVPSSATSRAKATGTNGAVAAAAATAAAGQAHDGKLRFHPYGRGGGAELDSDGMWRPW